MTTTIPSTSRPGIARGAIIALAVGLLTSSVVVPASAANAAPADSADVVLASAPASAHLPNTADRLDTIGALVSHRLQLADPVAESKWLSGKPITDAAREQAVVDEAVALAQQEGVDPQLVTRVIRAQIEASKVVQRGLITRWTHHPDAAPTTAPDLTTIRPQLDAIDTDLVTAIGQVQALSTDPTCAHLVDAERKRLTAGLDSLHRKGIRAAWQGFCTP
jgi:chorismate mutase